MLGYQASDQHKKNTCWNGTVIDTTNHLLFVGLALETAQSLASETNHHWHMKKHQFIVRKME